MESCADKTAVITGVLLLFVGNGAVIWAEEKLPSSLVAVLVCCAYLVCFNLINRDGKKFRSRPTIIGLAVDFVG